jgi:hypothetical protein
MNDYEWWILKEVVFSSTHYLTFSCRNPTKTFTQELSGPRFEPSSFIDETDVLKCLIFWPRFIRNLFTTKQTLIINKYLQFPFTLRLDEKFRDGWLQVVTCAILTVMSVQILTESLWLSGNSSCLVPERSKATLNHRMVLAVSVCVLKYKPMFTFIVSTLWSSTSWAIALSVAKLSTTVRKRDQL